ncbi:NAD-P-binding protein [Cristinia sonorae]|uniref:NAD-P-binding protein n=1 Tax=Cristinia sonorae TaxID=1940300 RepID=A0A8K0UH12_9AGAR|nr:NAD-P-binding protein [Cristinia sonorae]
MRLLILGGTGPAGLQLIQQALAASHVVAILARSPQKLPNDISTHPSVTVIEGQLTDIETLSRAVKGVDAILSALGPPASVTGALTYPSNTPLAHAYSAVIASMKEHNVQRIILLGTPSITDERDHFSARFAALVAGVATLAHNSYKDIVAVGDVVRKEGMALQWTIARVPVLTDDPSKAVIAGYIGDGKANTTIPRAAFAAFVLQELEESQWCQKAPLISSP